MFLSERVYSDLVALVVKSVNPSTRVVGVNAENSPHYYMAMKHGKVVNTEIKSTLADGMALNLGALPSYIADNSVKLIRETIDEVVTVSEEKIKDAIRFLTLENKLVVEGAGAISLVAALQTPKEQRGKTVCIISGGSIDSDKLVEILK